ncbi:MULTISPECIES: hypothetical protein [Pseudoalteromonas]|uniref:hypothetical protein n=1 Tax=Pseudoalteromonas TaxID=53246 RepID=UPI000299E69B|nr:MULTISPECIES: hypothetical protein [Pseudoalteromonas]AUJ69740.1 hypothetical protein PNC201_07210 [Pseudoalteromonas sp. NC201]MCG7552282.1 hypothetical protein [Pseudoalteromonas sp. Of11M-6]MCX2765745.1 hypothetical protein [Pseudoalteromonas sp. B530]
MNILTSELPSCLKFENDSFVEIFTRCKLTLMIDIIEKEVLSNKPLSELFDKLSERLSTNDLYQLLKLPRFWNTLIARRGDEKYQSTIERLLITELSFLEFNPDYIIQSDFIDETSVTWNLRGNLGYQASSDKLFKNQNVHPDSNILLDYFSDLARGVQKDIPWDDTGITPELIQCSTPKIYNALDYIKAVSDPCYTILKESICSIAIRFDKTKNRFNCASTNISNGLIVLINPNLSEVSVETIADAIVHEMTHNLFDLAELYEPCLPTKFHSRIIKSPWTGRMLDPNTYIQACYTWYGLKNFWRKAYAYEPSDNAYYYLQQASRGFSSSSFLDAITDSKFEIEQRLFDTLKNLQSLGS